MANIDDVQLKTSFVYLDTEAFRRHHFDWNGKVLGRFAELCRNGTLQLLYTSVNKREVFSQLESQVGELRAALRKHRTIMGQLGFAELFQVVSTPEAPTMLRNRFEEYLASANALVVPLNADVERLVSDYFTRQPPFSLKKKSEFPDAIVVASLNAWCAKRDAQVYVVSGDGDFAESCSRTRFLIHAPSVENIISKATESRSFDEQLLLILSKKSDLRDLLEDQIRSQGVSATWHLTSMLNSNVSAVIESMQDIEITAVNVLRREGDTLECEIEFEVAIALEIEVEEMPSVEYWTTSVHRMGQSIRREFFADLTLRTNLHQDQIPTIVEVLVHGNGIELDFADLYR